MFIIYLLTTKKGPPSSPAADWGWVGWGSGGWWGSFIVYEKRRKERKEKKGGGRGKKIIPKYNKRRTVSADFHLHKFSYILVKIIAEPSTAPAQSRQREENLREHRVVGKRHTDNRFQATREQR